MDDIFEVRSFARAEKSLSRFRTVDPTCYKAEVDWYRIDGKKPSLDYTKAIKGYRRLCDEDRRDAEQVLDECFTAEEAQQMRAYLERCGMEVVVERIRLPIRPRTPVSAETLGPGLVLPYPLDLEDGPPAPIETEIMTREVRMLGPSRPLPFEVGGILTTFSKRR